MVLNGLDSRDLVQFIPRAFVFITIIVLYSMLFNFLRRPDTIQLSSQFVSGEVRPNESASRSQHKGLFAALKWRSKRSSSGHAAQNGDGHSASKIDPNAPWEQLEFVQIGGRNPFSPSRSALHFSPTTSMDRPADSHFASPIHSRPGSPPFLDSSRPSSTPDPLLPPTHRPSLASVFTMNSELQTPPYAADSQRPSESTLVSTPELRYHGNGTPSHHHVLSPVLSQPSAKSDGRMDGDIELDLGPDVVHSLRVPSRTDDDDSPSGQTLKEFFSDDHVSRPMPHDSQAERGVSSSGNGGAPQMSATAYFNRQASLLMLYFPLAVSRVPGPADRVH